MEWRRRLLNLSPNFVLDTQNRCGMARTREAEEYRVAPPKTIRPKRGQPFPAARELPGRAP